MGRRELPRERWVEFFEEYSVGYAGWIADLEWTGEDPERTCEGIHALVGIEGDFENGKGSLTISLTDRDPIIVENPLRISLLDGEDGDDELLEIESSDCILYLHLRFPTSEIQLGPQEPG